MDSRRAPGWVDGLTLGLVAALAAGLRLLLAVDIEPTLHDVIPFIESYNYAGSHDPVSLAWRALTGVFWPDPPVAWFRVPSFLASVALVVLLSRQVRDDFGRGPGLVAGLLAAVSFPLVLVSAQVRGYSIHILGLWLMLSGLRAMLADGRGSRAFVAGAFLAIAHQFVTVVAATGGILLFLFLAAWWDSRPARNLRTAASLRTLAAGMLVVGAAGAMWFANLALTGVNAAYQKGSPHLAGVGQIDQRGLLRVFLWPFGWIQGGPSWTNVPWFGLVLAGLWFASRRRPGDVRLTLVAWLSYAALPVVLNLTVGSIGMQPGQAAFLVIPLILWASVGIAGLASGVPVPAGWNVRLFRGAARTLAGIALVILAVPNAEAVFRYARRGYSMETGYRFGEMADRLDGLLVDRNLVFLDSGRFFHSAHLFAWRFGASAHRIDFVTEKLLQPPLFRRFLLHDYSHAPGTYFDLVRWHDFDSLVADRERFTGRVFLFLPNVDTQSLEEWLNASPAFLYRRCGNSPHFPGGMQVWEGTTGWIAWFDVAEASPADVVDRLRAGWAAWNLACPDAGFQPVQPPGPHGMPGLPRPPGPPGQPSPPVP